MELGAAGARCTLHWAQSRRADGGHTSQDWRYTSQAAEGGCAQKAVHENRREPGGARTPHVKSRDGPIASAGQLAIYMQYRSEPL